jgi:hypothetical protein
MSGFNRLMRILLIGSFVAISGIAGCSPKTSGGVKDNADEAKLEEARTSAESAEKKLTDLKQERVQLENSQHQKQADVNQGQQ